MTDHCFLRPRAVFLAGKITVQDAINLVAYAKVPLKSRLTGERLIAGCVRTDVAGHSSIGERPSMIRMWPQDVQEWISGLRYPVPPLEYEAHLVELVETGFDELPFFMHDHHLVNDQRWRAGRCKELYGELQDAVSDGHITVRGADGQQTDILSPESWMSERTLLSYLNQQSALSWWEGTSNLNNNDRLERILISDALQTTETSSEIVYDPHQIPSLLFAHMLLRQTRATRDLARVEAAGRSAVQIGKAASDPEFANSYFQANKRRLPARDHVTETAEVRSLFQEIESGNRSVPQVGTNSSVKRALSSKGRNASPVGHSEDSHAGVEETIVADLRHSAEQPTHPQPTRNNRLQVKKQIISPTGTSAAIVAATDDDRISKKEVARMLGKHPNSVDNLRKHDPSFPEPSMVGGSLRWKRGDVLHWLELQAS